MNSFGARSTLRAAGRTFQIFRLQALDAAGFKVARLPYPLRILLENLLRHEDGVSVTADDIAAVAGWDPVAPPAREIAFTPARVLMQDFTGVPAVADLAAMRDAVAPFLEQLGFHTVGYGCATCIGNSGPLPAPVSEAIAARHLVVCAALSGNRNFEGRIHSEVRANYLMSPPLVVAYALAGRMDWDPYSEPLGAGGDGRPVLLSVIWPAQDEIRRTIELALESEMFGSTYAEVFTGDEVWRLLPIPGGDLFQWDPDSTYVKRPPFFDGMPREAPETVPEIRGGRALAVLGDRVTTDHISPAGTIKADSPAGSYLIERGVEPKDFNSYGARRGNYEVMVRGTVASARIRNHLVPGTDLTDRYPAGGALLPARRHPAVCAPAAPPKPGTETGGGGRPASHGAARSRGHAAPRPRRGRLYRVVPGQRSACELRAMTETWRQPIDGVWILHRSPGSRTYPGETAASMRR